MFKKRLVALSFVGFTLIWPFEANPTANFDMLEILKPKPLAEKTMNLTDRYPDSGVNEVFADNILLVLHYLKDPASAKAMAGEWDKVRQPFDVELTLLPGQAFAFHDQILPELKDKVVKTTGAHFNWDDGFKSDGWLIGDGVCHLATLINWAAQSAGLRVTALVNHDFLPVPGIPKEYGTSIIWMPDGGRGSARQNLYVENTFDFPVTLTFKATTAEVELLINK